MALSTRPERGCASSLLLGPLLLLARMAMLPLQGLLLMWPGGCQALTHQIMRRSLHLLCQEWRACMQCRMGMGLRQVLQTGQLSRMLETTRHQTVQISLAASPALQHSKRVPCLLKNRDKDSDRGFASWQRSRDSNTVCCVQPQMSLAAWPAKGQSRRHTCLQRNRS